MRRFTVKLDFPDSSVGKESSCNAGDPSSIPGSGRSAGEGIGFPFQYSWASLVAHSAGKESACIAGDLGSIPGLGRSPGEGKGYPLQYSDLENSMDSPWGCKESDTTERLSHSEVVSREKGESGWREVRGPQRIFCTLIHLLSCLLSDFFFFFFKFFALRLLQRTSFYAREDFLR